jgi:hypothetical protein
MKMARVPNPDDNIEEEPAMDPTAFRWKGETYDFTKFDDVRLFQQNDEQYCYLSLNGRIDEGFGVRVPVTGLDEALTFQAIFHSVMPRIHGPSGGNVVQSSYPIDPKLMGR